MDRAFARAWLTCGALDLAYALIANSLRGTGVIATLSGVAAGPLGNSMQSWGAGAALLGLIVHFTIMAAMVAAYPLLMRSPPLGRMPWWLAGTLYGVCLWLVMYGLVLPLRFGAPFPNPDPLKTLLWFAPHVLCVGLPLAWFYTKADALRSS